MSNDFSLYALSSVKFAGILDILDQVQVMLVGIPDLI